MALGKSLIVFDVILWILWMKAVVEQHRSVGVQSACFSSVCKCPAKVAVPVHIRSTNINKKESGKLFVSVNTCA